MTTGSASRNSPDVNATNNAVAAMIDRLQLKPHPEGGWFRETARSQAQIALDALPDGYNRDGGDTRRAMTSILFLIPAGVRTHWHRLQSDELYVHHFGDDVHLMTHAPADRPDGERRTVLLGAGANAQFQAMVPSAWWQSAETVTGEHGYALLGCVVAPGFEFADFQMAE